MSFWTDHAMITRKEGKNRYNVVDVGAFKGNTVAKYREMIPQAQVYAFEPLPDMIAALHKRFRNAPWFHLIPKALSDEVGDATFYIGGAHGNQSSLFPRPFDGRRYYLSNLRPLRQTVQTTTLDAFMEEHNVGHVDVLKADVHGAFPAIMHGAHEALGHQKIDVIGVEVYFVPMYKSALLFHELVDKMEGYGYTVYGLYDLLTDRENHQLTVANATFVSHRFRVEVLNTFPEGWKPKGGS